ncbi:MULTISPECIES: polysaccharide deacetylase family protein [unclassified Clostridium]|uniref:polysaccharide deacetylase family protein n=1 Tax=unclassified Clostridium TaxID=2614128 RepID=UPI000298407A|nr:MULTISPECIES: polysaccharide deacetylase family protein [unclassified Clostridium]EKQ56555.1 MAG: putative xylanase/chitin deacetylase [Clostridium sp. Maddingley MBC34-26]
MKRKIIATIILLASILAGGYLYKNYSIKTNSGKLILNEKSAYDASKEIGAALNSFDSSNKAKVITNVNTLSNIVSLSFEGISDRDTMQKITEMLDKYGIKATFFIPGIKAAEDSDTVEMLQKNGHEIGNGTLNWKKNMQDLPSEDLVTDFCRTNNILKSITGKDPTLLKCNSTIYNDNILEAAYAAGTKYVVNSDHYISYQSFKNYDQAYQYLKNLKNGTIISIKLEGVLDSSEYGKKRVEEKPAIDKQASINDINIDGEKKIDITQIVEWLLKSINEQNRIVVKVSDLGSDEEGYDKSLYFLNNDGDSINTKTRNKINSSNGKLNENNITSNKELNKKNKSNTDSINFQELIEKNNGNQAPVISRFFTTQKALTYTFRGLSNEACLDKVLEKLDKMNAKGTFFVTKEEILKYPERINKILSKGHEIGNGGITNSSAILNKSTEEICKEIYDVDKLLKDKGITTNAYMPGYGYTNPKIREALSAVTNIPSLKNYELFTYTKNPIINKYKGMAAEEIVPDYFNTESYLSLRMGDIVYFRLDSNLFESNDVIANIIELLTKNYVKNGYVNKIDTETKSYNLTLKPLGYSVVTLNNLQNTIETPTQLGRYKILDNLVPMKKRTEADAIEVMKKNYIGNSDVDLGNFNTTEKNYLDKKGTINTNGENVIFFTFDDWGGDPEINEILNVLNKHNVHATFFVIAKYADVNSGISNANPNLLRTIAINGNDIGSHNYNHELLGTDVQALQESLVKSYNVMESVVGDLNSLKPYFRPPTLYLSKQGLESVFESGYKYSISGNITTHDYEKTSAQEIVNYIENGLVKNTGNIVVMHMNDQAYYTAEALDIFLTKNEKGLYGEKYKIAKLSDYLEK